MENVLGTAVPETPRGFNHPAEWPPYAKLRLFRGGTLKSIYSKISLRLYLLQSPVWMTLVSIRHITGEVLEDCVFFEHEGTLYMALAIQLGAMQYCRNSRLQWSSLQNL
ncbi:putative Female sterile M3 [Daphnia magna]|uniref:Putative Female sterile M3 n=1 Tax=Daphnia magna TaxID=35525 RepID=A0A162RHR0_9CRUS|nr:putative Female sterile M3 [Daphnia magna]